MLQSVRLIDDTPEAVLGVEHSTLGARWTWRCSDDRRILTLTQKLGIPDVLARILAGRDICHETADIYLQPSLKAQLPDPGHLKDMEIAVDRLATAILSGETVGVFGDYDVDGATSTALLLRYLEAVGARGLYHIPDRIAEGYGPNIEALLGLKNKGASLVVTVDCGAVSFEPLAAAKAEGLDVIVIDHHMGAAQLPEAVAVVNPNRLDETSDCRHLAAVGVTFLTLIALNRCLREKGFFAHRPQPDLLQWLDLVALGTVCDVVPLTGLNRAFVRQGLTVLAQRRNTGLSALMDQSRINETLSTYHLGFLLGPRINAGGRVGEASLGVRLLTTDDVGEAAAISARLEGYNAERQSIEQMVLEEAMAMGESQSNRSVIVTASEGWHPGVIGIVAGRLKERYQRPAAVIALDSGVGKGSARSVPGADFGAAVASARTQQMVLAGGGHAMAAGFSVDVSRIDVLHLHFESLMGHASDAHRHGRCLKIDACLNPSGLSLDLAELILRAAPFGQANSQPRFILTHCRPIAVERLKDKHVKLYFICDTGRGKRLSAIAFRAFETPLGEMLMGHKGKPLHLAGQLKKEVWQGESRLSFFIDDAHPPDAADRPFFHLTNPPDSGYLTPPRGNAIGPFV